MTEQGLEILKRVRTLRESKGFSQEQMAELMMITQSAYARFESGKSKTDLNTLELFCEKVSYTLVDFFIYPKTTKDFEKQQVQERVSVTFEVSPEKRDYLLKLVTGE